MTLIITTACDDATIQVCDQRLTQGKKLYREEAIKVVCVSCTDAYFSIAYTGLAIIRRQTTDHWLVDNLIQSKAAKLPLIPFMKKLRALADKAFSSLKLRIGITFTMAGYFKDRPFMALLSNCESSDGKPLGGVDKGFHFGFWYRNEQPVSGFSYMVNGAELALDPSLKVGLHKARRRLLQSEPSCRVNVMIDLLRRAADHPKYGYLIGKDCLSTVILPQKGFETRYHPLENASTEYHPHVVTPDMAVRDFKVTFR